MDGFLTGHFWMAVGQLVIIDILLSGDNAVVIALACRQLAPGQRMKGIAWGTAGAIMLRVILIAFAMSLLQLPWLKLVGAILLVWIGVRLIAPGDEGHREIHPSERLLVAVRTIIVADLVMSGDNVIAIAGAAKAAGEQHELVLVLFGLLFSVSIIVWGSTLVLKLMDRLPVVITLGGMLLGWIAGTMAYKDPVLASHVPQGDWWGRALGMGGALTVFVLAQVIERRNARLRLAGHGEGIPLAREGRQESS